MSEPTDNSRAAASPQERIVRRASVFVAVVLGAIIVSSSKVVSTTTVVGVIQCWGCCDTGVMFDRGYVLIGCWPKGHSTPFGIVIHGVKVWWQPCSREIR